MTSGRNLKNSLIQRTKYRDIDLVLQLLSEKTQGLKDALETAHYQSIESIDVKTTYTAIGTATVLRGVSQLEEKVDLQREEIYSVSVAAQKQNDLLSERIDSLRALFEAQLIEKEEVSGAHLTSAGEAPPSDLGAWFIEKVEDMLIANKSMFINVQFSIKCFCLLKKKLESQGTLRFRTTQDATSPASLGTGEAQSSTSCSSVKPSPTLPGTKMKSGISRASPSSQKMTGAV